MSRCQDASGIAASTNRRCPRGGDRNPPGSPPKLDRPSRPAAAPTTPVRRTRKGESPGAAWTALVRSLFAAGLTIDATWPIEMEMKNRMRGLNSAALETSITVVCRPRVAGPPAEFRDVRDEIRRVVQESVRRFWSYGFRGADLIVACYG